MEIETLAKESARAFVEEFGEALDPSKTDWDAIAWVEDRRHVKHFGMAGIEDVEAWEMYQAVLITETKNIVRCKAIDAGEIATDADTFSLSEAAWQEAFNRVAAGGTTVCEIWSRRGIYTLSYVRGAERLGYISEDREGRIWQCTDSDDARHELDPAKGGRGFRYY